MLIFRIIQHLNSEILTIFIYMLIIKDLYTFFFFNILMPKIKMKLIDLGTADGLVSLSFSDTAETLEKTNIYQLE